MLETFFRLSADNLLLGMEAAVALFIGLVCVFLALEAVLAPLIKIINRPSAEKARGPHDHH